MMGAQEELSALGRRGGQPRSYAPVPHRLAQPSSGVFKHIAISETAASLARAFA